MHVGPRAALDEQPDCVAQYTIVEDDAPKSKRPLDEVVALQDGQLQLRLGQHVEVELGREVPRLDCRSDEVVVHVADPRPRATSGGSRQDQASPCAGRSPHDGRVKLDEIVREHAVDLARIGFEPALPCRRIPKAGYPMFRGLDPHCISHRSASTTADSTSVATSSND